MLFSSNFIMCTTTIGLPRSLSAIKWLCLSGKTHQDTCTHDNTTSYTYTKNSYDHPSHRWNRTGPRWYGGMESGRRPAGQNSPGLISEGWVAEWEAAVEDDSGEEEKMYYHQFQSIELCDTALLCQGLTPRPSMYLLSLRRQGSRHGRLSFTRLRAISVRLWTEVCGVCYNGIWYRVAWITIRNRVVCVAAC